MHDSETISYGRMSCNCSHLMCWNHLSIPIKSIEHFIGDRVAKFRLGMLADE